MAELSEMEKLVAKAIALGIKEYEFDFEGARYAIQGIDVLLKEVYIEEGTFTIPKTVTGLYREEYSDLCYAFKNCVKLKVINHSRITDMSCMFIYCNKLKELDLTDFDTSKVTNMVSMFSNCCNLEKLELKLDTSNVENMEDMFFECNKLRKLKPDFDTSKVRSMRSMFSCCYKLTNLTLNFDTGNVENMDYMFQSCTNLKKLKLDFDTKSLKSMQAMFKSCIKLEELDLCSMKIPLDTDKKLLLWDCHNLKRIIMKGRAVCSE